MEIGFNFAIMAYPYAVNFMNSLLSLQVRLKEEQIDSVYLFEKDTVEKECVHELIT